MQLAERFAKLKAKDEAALVLFLTAGDQDLGQLFDIIDVAADGGADIVEVGIPFSDPFGEGPTIQASSQRSLENGTTTAKVLEALSKRAPSTVLVTMGYYNPALKFGLENYANRLAEVGVSGSILTDLTPEEAEPWQAASEKADIGSIYLVAPTSSEDRIERAVRLSTGFVYAVSRTGVTGSQEMSQAVGELVDSAKRISEKPVCVGFGLSTPDHVRFVSSFADGAVVGSSFVDTLHKGWQNGRGSAEVKSYVKALKAATVRS